MHVPVRTIIPPHFRQTVSPGTEFPFFLPFELPFPPVVFSVFTAAVTVTRTGSTVFSAGSERSAVE
jgi:hypothetical protein